MNNGLHSDNPSIMKYRVTLTPNEVVGMINVDAPV